MFGGALSGLIARSLGGPKVYFHDFANFHDIPPPKGYALEDVEEGQGVHDHGHDHGNHWFRNICIWYLIFLELF